MSQPHTQNGHHQAPRPTDLHRLYIQSLLSRRAMRDEVALELYRRAVGACQSHDDSFRPTHGTTMQGLRAFLLDVSDVLHDVGMEVSIGSEQSGRGKQWVVLRNTDPTEVALQATDLTPNEIEYFRKVIEGIIVSYPANSISHGQALSLVSELEGQMTKSSAELLLDALCSRGWLSKSKRGRYSLGVRGATELEPYLKQEYEDYVNNCKQCKRLMLAGVACASRGCTAHFHSYCYASILKLPRPSCPDCSTRFKDLEPRDIGEKAVSRAEDEFRGGLRKRKRQNEAAANGNRNGNGNGNGKSSRKGKGRASQANNEDEDEDDDEETEDDGDLELEEAMVEAEGEEEEEESALAGGSGFVERGAGPSGWRVDGTSRRRSVVPETQYQDEDEGEDEEEVEEEEQEEEEVLPPSNRRRSTRR
ncbi:hypothetical protein I316_02191 [Kwoniella heveanensis BCC8398]|uniref:Non-structural maintenance of chromosomes element 1 homolog n=1 Tax=Kwoniella heveanensis BCC8398 TaxID=1296120 RepID=A0A1B9GZ69_9TREE|nr:hypothetical protein I316_02191 [Kwoniella heveanensis BCC8398]